jgi:hypothetical protein
MHEELPEAKGCAPRQNESGDTTVLRYIPIVLSGTVVNRCLIRPSVAIRQVDYSGSIRSRASVPGESGSGLLVATTSSQLSSWSCTSPPLRHRSRCARPLADAPRTIEPLLSAHAHSKTGDRGLMRLSSPAAAAQICARSKIYAKVRPPSPATN